MTRTCNSQDIFLEKREDRNRDSGRAWRDDDRGSWGGSRGGRPRSRSRERGSWGGWKSNGWDSYNNSWSKGNSGGWGGNKPSKGKGKGKSSKGKGKGRGKGKGKGKDEVMDADGLDDDLDKYFGRESTKDQKKSAKLDGDLDDYFKKDDVTEAPEATEEKAEEAMDGDTAAEKPETAEAGVEEVSVEVSA